MNDDDDLLNAMLDFEDEGDNTVAAAPPPAAQPPRAMGVPQPGPAGSFASGAPSPARGGGAAPAMPGASPVSPAPVPSTLQQQQGLAEVQAVSTHYASLGRLLARAQPAKQAQLLSLNSTLKTHMATAKGYVEKIALIASYKDNLKRIFGEVEVQQGKIELAAMKQQQAQAAAAQAQAAAQGGGGAAAPGAPGLQAAAAQQQQQQQQQLLHQQRQVAAAQQQQLQQQQQQRSGSQPPARAQSPFPATAGGPPGVTLTPQQVVAAQQMQMQAAAAAAAAVGGAKRPADASAGGGEAAAAKRPKAALGGGAGAGGRKKEVDDTNMTVDNLYDWDRETDQLMEGLQRERVAGRLRPQTTSNQQFLSEWRVGHEFYRQIQRTGGGLSVKPECFELVQLAFQAHLTQVIQRSLRSAGHRQDAYRRSGEMLVTSDPRRGVTQIERREKAKADARLEVERAQLLKMAGSKRADEETKERAQKAKAELVGKQQASLANAAVAATLGGKSKGKVNKWDKWSNAAAGTAAGGGEAPGEAGAAAAGGKKKGGGGKKGGKKGAAGAAGGAGSSEGGTAGAGEATTSAANSDASAAAGDGKMERAGSVKAPAARGRGGLTGTGSAPVGSDDASTIHLRDVLGCLERDPLYCKSGLLYRLYNEPRGTDGGSAAAPAQ